MPKPGFASITIRAQVKKRLEEYAHTKGYATLSDAINSLLDQATQCSETSKRLDELEARLRKLELILVKLLEELTAGKRAGPESPAGRGEGGDAVRELSRPVRTTHAAYPPEAPRGRDTQQDIE